MHSADTEKNYFSHPSRGICHWSQLGGLFFCSIPFGRECRGQSGGRGQQNIRWFPPLSNHQCLISSCSIKPHAHHYGDDRHLLFLMHRATCDSFGVMFPAAGGGGGGLISVICLAWFSSANMSGLAPFLCLGSHRVLKINTFLKSSSLNAVLGVNRRWKRPDTDLEERVWASGLHRDVGLWREIGERLRRLRRSLSGSRLTDSGGLSPPLVYTVC